MSPERYEVREQCTLVSRAVKRNRLSHFKWSMDEGLNVKSQLCHASEGKCEESPQSASRRPEQLLPTEVASLERVQLANYMQQ